MKKSFLILVIAGFLLIGLSEIQAQTAKAGHPDHIWPVQLQLS